MPANEQAVAMIDQAIHELETAHRWLTTSVDSNQSSMLVDINNLRRSIDELMRAILTTIRPVRNAIESVSIVAQGTTGMLAEAIQSLQQIDEDLTTKVQTLAGVKRQVDDMANSLRRDNTVNPNKVTVVLNQLRSYRSIL
jgi:uncharacterized protein YoxC